MINSTSIKNYANALSDLAKAGLISFEEIKKDLNTVDAIITSSRDLKNVLENVTISAKIKHDITDEVFKNQINKKIINFLKILIDKNKFNEFADIKSEFENIYNEQNNIKLVEVTSAVELTKSQKTKVLKKLQAKLNKEIIADWKLDKEIIGGLIIKIGDDIINSSLKNRLEKLTQ